MHENDDELSAIRQHLSQTPTEGAGALEGASSLVGALAGKDARAGEGAMSGTSIHEDDELSLIKQHLSQTPTEGAGALAGEGAQASALPGALSGALPGPGADEGVISATSIDEGDDEVFEKQQHLSAGAVEGASSATSVHEDEIRQHLSHAPRTSILPVLSKTTVS